MRAFKVNSIDYILKPVDEIELINALEKLKGLRGTDDLTNTFVQNLGHAIKMLTKKHKERFVVKVGEHLRTIEIQDVNYFYSQDKTTFCVTTDNRHHILDYTLEQLQELVNTDKFYRISRKYLVGSNAIIDIISHSNSRLKLILQGSQDKDIIVARERVQDFKQWLDR